MNISINKLLLTLMVGSLAVYSCTNEVAEEMETTDSRVPMSFSAIQEECGSRAEIGTTADGVTQITWVTNDAISIFDGTANNKFSTADNGSTAATFTGTANSASTYYAISPYQKDASLSGTTITANIPATQIATNGTFDPHAALMVASSTETSTLSFKNVVSFIKITTSYEYQQITVRSLDWTGLAGKVNITTGTAPSSSFVAGCDTAFVRLLPSSGNTIPAGTYYIAVAPGTHANGVEIICTDEYNFVNIYQKKSAMTFTRSKVKNRGNIEDAPCSFYVRPVDLGLTVDWADRNIGANTPNGYGAYFWWGALSNATAANRSIYKTGSVAIQGTEHDIVHMLWGGKWRMPSSTEMSALKTGGSFVVETIDEVDFNCFQYQQGGFSVSLPIAGYLKSDGSLAEDQVTGRYWTGDNTGATQAYFLNVTSSNKNVDNYGYRNDRAYTIRGVCEK